MLPAPSSDGRFECPCHLLSHPSRSRSAPQHTPALSPRSYLLVLSGEGSWFGLLRQLSVVIGELVGQYAQLIWVGCGFGDNQKSRRWRGPTLGQASKEGGDPAWVAGTTFCGNRLACTHPLLHSHCDGLGHLYHRGLVVHRGPLWLTHWPIVQLQETIRRFWLQPQARDVVGFD